MGGGGEQESAFPVVLDTEGKVSFLLQMIIVLLEQEKFSLYRLSSLSHAQCLRCCRREEIARRREQMIPHLPLSH